MEEELEGVDEAMKGQEKEEKEAKENMERR